MSYEKHIIVGNLGNDPELRHAKDGTPVTNFSVAVNKTRNGNESVTWVRVTAWNGQAENAVQYLKKGSRVLIEGSNLEAVAYTSKKDNQPRARLELTADRVVYLDRAPESGNDDVETGDIPF